jgi:CheY-like chemotaxis protein
MVPVNIPNGSEVIRPPTVLFIEDSDEDFSAFMRLLAPMEFSYHLRHLWDGDEALDYFYGRGDYGDRAQNPLPSLVLLDLNLPGLDGREVLRTLKEDVRLRRIPITILSTSSNPNDVDDCYQLGASGYLVKSMQLDRLRKTLETYFQYWLTVVNLPTLPEG